MQQVLRQRFLALFLFHEGVDARLMLPQLRSQGPKLRFQAGLPQGVLLMSRPAVSRLFRAAERTWQPSRMNGLLGICD